MLNDKFPPLSNQQQKFSHRPPAPLGAGGARPPPPPATDEGSYPTTEYRAMAAQQAADAADAAARELEPLVLANVEALAIDDSGTAEAHHLLLHNGGDRDNYENTCHEVAGAGFGRALRRSPSLATRGKPARSALSSSHTVIQIPRQPS